MDGKLRKAGEPLPVCETVQKRFMGFMLRLYADDSIYHPGLPVAKAAKGNAPFNGYAWRDCKKTLLITQDQEIFVAEHLVHYRKVSPVQSTMELNASNRQAIAFNMVDRSASVPQQP